MAGVAVRTNQPVRVLHGERARVRALTFDGLEKCRKWTLGPARCLRCRSRRRHRFTVAEGATWLELWMARQADHRHQPDARQERDPITGLPGRTGPASVGDATVPTAGTPNPSGGCPISEFTRSLVPIVRQHAIRESLNRLDIWFCGTQIRCRLSEIKMSLGHRG